MGNELEKQVEELKREVESLKEALVLAKENEKDPVSGVFVREMFIRYANERLQEDKDTAYSLVMTDIEHYKHLVERYGKPYINQYMKQIGEYARSLSNRAICGKYSADRFVILLPREDFLRAEKKQQEEIPLKKALSSDEIRVKFGVVPEIDKREEITTVCDHAFTAIRQIKHEYGIYVKYFDELVEKRIKDELMIQDSMQTALEEKQFTIYYQPKTDVKTGKIGGAEALVRWIHPTLGFMNPGLFIPVFEKNGFIATLDKYIWEAVLQMLSERIKLGKPVVPISINISRRDFDYYDLADGLTHLVDRYQIDHSLIHLEVTESAYSDRPDKIRENINALHRRGFTIELDDFGSGYTSLSSLNDMDLDILKLDMSLLEKDDAESKKSILSFAFQLAKMMNLKTVQEGVETEEQSERIRSLDGDYIQGYFYSKPLPREAFEKYIDEHI